MKILVTGANGQLGTDIAAELKRRNHEAILADIGEFDICDEKATFDFVTSAEPDAVIHCAAWTAVDAAEDINNVDRVYKINCTGTINVAEACKKLDCKLIYLSTDYVFGNNGTLPIGAEYEEFEPQSVYAKSKLMGEFAVKELVRKHIIVRISWVFGKNGKNFVRSMLSLGKTHDKLRVVEDQIGRPTYTPDLARLLVDMAESEKYGVYHATNEGENISWADYAREIFRLAGLNVKVTGISTEEYGASAERPRNSRLDTSKLKENGFEPLPDWKDALERYLKEINYGKDNG